MEFWNIIVQSNTFNFAVLVLILAVLYQKLNVSQALDNIRQNIVSTIDNAVNAKNQANDRLKRAQIMYGEVSNEIEVQTNDAIQKAKSISQDILKNTEKSIASIKVNADKVIKSEEKTLSQLAIDSAIRKSSELAKNHIKNLLRENPKLHEQFIENSIKEI